MKSKNKWYIKWFAASLLVISVIVGSRVVTHISAYFIDGDMATNQIQIGGSKIQIAEDFHPPKEILPGVSFQKDVKITNLGSCDCYVRMKAVFSNSDMGQYCEVDWNIADWIYHEEDGYYYYKKILTEGESSTSLFTTITLKEHTPENSIKDFDIIVYAESYQAEGFDTYVSAWKQYKENKPGYRGGVCNIK